MASYVGPLLSSLETHFYSSLDRGLIPDFVLRPAIRSLCRLRLREIARETVTEQTEGKWEFVESLKGRPVAIEQGACRRGGRRRAIGKKSSCCV